MTKEKPERRKKLTLPLPHPLQHLLHLPHAHPIDTDPLLRTLERPANVLLNQDFHAPSQSVFTALGSRVGRQVSVDFGAGGARHVRYQVGQVGGRLQFDFAVGGGGGARAFDIGLED